MNSKSIDALVEDHNRNAIHYDSPPDTPQPKPSRRLGISAAFGGVEGHVKNSGEIVELSEKCDLAPEPSMDSINPFYKQEYSMVGQKNFFTDIVSPNLQSLLGSVLTSIDASIPNKDQNKATKHLICKQFDEAYCDILDKALPDAEPGYDYAIGICVGDFTVPTVLSVWRKGKEETPLVQVLEYGFMDQYGEDHALSTSLGLGKKFGKYIPDGPLFIIEQITCPGDLLLHQLKFEGFHRFNKTKISPNDKPKEGWYTNAWSRTATVERFLTAYKEKKIVVNSGLLRNDITGAEWDGKKLLLPSGNDNRFMAAAIAVNSFLETDQEV